MRITPWNERQLTFGRGIDELPLLVERVLGTPARIMLLVQGLPLERISMRVTGRWSVKDHLAHLILLDERMEVRADDLQARRGTLSPIALDDQDRFLSIHRHRPFGDMVEEFRLRRNYLVGRFAQLDASALEHRAEHPCRGMSMSAVDQLLFIAEHDDHHLALMRSAVLAQQGARN
ncbi:MAG: DinB family protein [Flavobacteriales bacterium]